MNPFEMVLGIIIVVTIGRVLTARFGGNHGRFGQQRAYGINDDAAAIAENHRLKSEITDLRERIQVLERVVTDNEGSLRLDREIEKLRDGLRKD
jgi:hypothetical protein